MNKIMVVAAAAAGYVLGSRAGRAHYEILEEQARKLWRSPQVQQASDIVKNTAEQVTDQTDAAGDSPQDTASNGARHAAEQAHSEQGPYPGDADGAGTQR